MENYVRAVLRHRLWVVAATLAVTAFLGYFAAGLRIVIDPRTLMPSGHPLVQSSRAVEAGFGSKYMVLIGLTPTEGDALQPAVIDAVRRITRALAREPGVVRATLTSLASDNARAIRAEADGFDTQPLVAAAGSPESAERDAEATRRLLHDNPVFQGTVLSGDGRTAAVLVEMKERDDGYRNMMAPVERIARAEQSDRLQVRISGSPVYLAKTEAFAERITLLFPLAIVVIGLLHFEAFRTVQGLLLPLVTALLAVVWGVGFMGLVGQPLDIFNSATPILILAVAAGHAVQLLKRYYEDYERLRSQPVPLGAVEANREAVVRSCVGAGPVMIVAGGVAVLGFLSLLVFKVETIRCFGLFTAVGIASAVVLELSFIPAVRSMLRPPSDRERRIESRERLWDRVPRRIADAVVRPAGRRVVVVATVVFCILAAWGTSEVVVDSDSKSFFSETLPLQRDDAFLNRELGGTNVLYVMARGAGPDAVKSPRFLQALEELQRFAQAQPGVGKTVSIVDFLRRMNRAMHGDDPAADRLPETQELVSQYLLLYSMSGGPDDFAPWVDNDYRSAKLSVLIRFSGSVDSQPLLQKLKGRAAELFGPEVEVGFGGDIAQNIALSETMVRGKLLNIAQIGAAVFIVSALVFRSLVAGLLVLAPLVVVMLSVFGAMGFTGTPLNVPNSLIAAMAVGIGADYAIYLLFRMREQVRSGLAPEAAMTASLLTVGKATLFVATAVAGGYGVLALSFDYRVHQWLAGFIALAMVVGAVASLTLVPALLLACRPAFIFRPAAPAGRLATVALMAAVIVCGLSAPDAARAQATAGSASTADATALMRKADALGRFKDSASVATMLLTTADGGTRSRGVDILTRASGEGDATQRLVRFTAPADIKGTATLLVEHPGADDDMWIYLPALSKVRRLASANKKDSFFGTDFSYADVIGQRPEQWKHALLREEVLDGTPCWVIESLPLDDKVRSDTGYSKRTSWVAKTNGFVLRSDVADLDGRPLKRLGAADLRMVGADGRLQPFRLDAKNLQTGHETRITYDSFKIDQNLPASRFTQQELSR